MLQLLSRNQKLIAYLLTTIMYVELCLSPLQGHAAERWIVAPRPRPAHGIIDWNNNFKPKLPVASSPADKAGHPDVPLAQQRTEPVFRRPARRFTTGPTQPEMQSFQPVGSNNMVDLFTGDFTYNIPLLDVGGYPVNLHYQSGITMDQDASWVGLGWNINPGTITRNMRGLPDDFKGADDAVKKTVSMKENKTVGVTAGLNVELVGFPLNIGRTLGIFHNTYRGWGTEVGVNANISAAIGSRGAMTGSLAFNNNSQTGYDVSPSLGFRISSKETSLQGAITIGTNYNSRTGVQSLQMSGEVKQHSASYKQQLNTVAGINSYISFSKPSYTPTISVPFTSRQFSFTAKVGGESWGVHPNGSIRGYSSNQKIEDKDKTLSLPSFGYLYYEKAGSDQHVLLDFNREKDAAFTDKTPNIAVPMYTYDSYSITGEGTGGMFRPYRGDIGYVFDHSMITKSGSDKFSLDVGFGATFHGGVDYNKVYAVTENKPWLADNTMKDVLQFKDRDTTFENVYFKNPGEKTSTNRDFLNAIGDDYLVRADLSPLTARNVSSISASNNLSLFRNSRQFDKRTLSANTLRLKRDNRTQSISYLTAEDATHAGLDTVIKSYNINSFPSPACITNYFRVPRIGNGRRRHHISEVTVLNPDGRRYVYGVPVYNTGNVQVTMATKTGDNANGLVDYTANDNSTVNNSGKDGYYNREEMPSYAHSFLLSGILSPDYVDVTGDGITEDDMGDAVKFNYSRIYDSVSPYRWRAPFQSFKAAYNEGLKTDTRDEKGSFSFGKREVWYLNSVESKTMIATFVLEVDSLRLDAMGVLNENGGLDASQKLYRLREINLYAKADYFKNGTIAARPIKTVHFDYSYELCNGNPSSQGGTGKLTLKRVWFTYNNNNKRKQNPYEFTYHPTNPSYSGKSFDRWGNYKDPALNPGGLTNADFPYTLQPGGTWDSAAAASNAAAWTLSKIKIPSGAAINVTYESDDYAYVQNKRAMQFFSLAGFGNNATSQPVNNLYPASGSGKDYNYVFVNVSDPVQSRADIQEKYLAGVSKLFFKLYVKMPDDPAGWGKGYEIVPCYADIEDYGVKSGSSGTVIWIRMSAVNSDASPTATAALQFLRLNLPSKAYPYSEPGDDLSIRNVIGMLLSVGTNIKDMIYGYDKRARKSNYGNLLALDKSFIRLDNPGYKKLGGGLRVKRIEIRDAWDKMTKQKQQESVYGQEYDYSTTLKVNGISKRISSGVASYEPAIGNDENPFKVPVSVYAEKVGAFAPTDFMYTEEPFGETFFPSPMVGYSKVRIQTIHKDKKSANGLEETEFYTTKDFPTLVEYTPLDDESKKTYNPGVNFLQFNAKHYVTLSQGFKVELNDMNGKIKSQASYSQNNLNDPISYTYNYYRLQNDNALQQKLSNKVAVADSANGVINTNGELGKDVEIMVDMREQTSKTISSSKEANLDVTTAFPPFIWGSLIPMGSSETNRYRSIAILKIVSRYGLLDSVIHIEKGSKVTTRNLLYDGQTGDVLVSQTNNEFDDPVYNFTYPAHWSYSGMGLASKNIGTVLSGVMFKRGVMTDATGNRLPAKRYFESGDEILAMVSDNRLPFTNDYCSPYYYLFTGQRFTRLWAIDASKGKEGEKGIFFIDRNGIPYSGIGLKLWIIRSGKRNMPSTPVGSVTTLKSPIQVVNGTTRLVVDSSISVVAATAGRFRDFWRVDSTGYAKDTTIISSRRVDSVTTSAFAKGVFIISNHKGRRGKRRLQNETGTLSAFEASQFNKGGNSEDNERRSWLLFDFHDVPKGAVIKSAGLYLTHHNTVTHLNEQTPYATNASYLARLTGPWPGDIVTPNRQFMEDYFYQTRSGIVDMSSSVVLPATAPQVASIDDVIGTDITAMAQGMLDQYYSSAGTVQPAMMIWLRDLPGINNGSTRRLAYASPKGGCWGGSKDWVCQPRIDITYYLPCANSSKPVYSATPAPGYYCYDNPKDTIVCRPSISDTAVNPYRWGILGNWRMDRAYTYYADRKNGDPVQATNIRTDGEIQSFLPYWTFTDSLMNNNFDSARWVWNSEMTLFNKKGFEIENHDPLDRFNAGQYGYGRSLPIAVGQNMKNREMVFDGFEDYGYRTDTCKRCQTERFAEWASGGSLVDSVSHTGQYSLRLNGNQTLSKVVPVASYATDTVTAKLSMKLDSTALTKTTVASTGTGLTTYFRDNKYLFLARNCTNNQYINVGYTSNINQDWTRRIPPGGCRATDYSLKWRGYVQPRYTGVYTFYIYRDDRMELYITRNGVTKKINPKVTEGQDSMEFVHPCDTVQLQAGELYFIEAIYSQDADPGYSYLYWESQGAERQEREIVPLSQLYPETVNPATVKASTVRTDTSWCVRLRNPTGTRLTLDKFSLLQGKKIVVSAWVKQEMPCISGSYDNARLELLFDNTGATTLALQPKGNIIEGWQRIEDTLTVPPTATSVSISMRSTSSSVVFFDDIRIHPFNGNMKSFVYDPINIRLMAELDENNYATFYEYDDDGTLIRLKKETERGIKTIRETRSSLIKQ